MNGERVSQEPAVVTYEFAFDISTFAMLGHVSTLSRTYMTVAGLSSRSGSDI